MPTKMIYQMNSMQDPEEVLLYHVSAGLYGEGSEFFGVSWCSRTDSWIVAPIWCFKPVKNTLLTEG